MRALYSGTEGPPGLPDPADASTRVSTASASAGLAVPLQRGDQPQRVLGGKLPGPEGVQKPVHMVLREDGVEPPLRTHQQSVDAHA